MMETNNKIIIQKAEFNPNIKIYILISVGFILFVTIFGIPLLLFWLLGLGQYMSKRYYDNLTCLLTERHLMFKKGVLFKVEKTIPLENIQDLTFIDNPLLEYLDLRVLKIETAGNSNPKGSDMKLMGIKNASSFKEAVLAQREKLGRTINKASSLEDNPNETITGLMIEIRDLLKDIKDKN